MFDDDRPTKPSLHEIGSDLSLLSVDELRHRIGTLQEEILRLEAEIESKNTSRSTAESLFSKK